MASEDKNSQYLAVKSMFLSGSVKRMKDIEKLYPTMIAKSLGINHSRYIEKLYKPEGFTIKNIIELANLVEISPQLILDVIIKQLSPVIKSKKKNI